MQDFFRFLLKIAALFFPLLVMASTYFIYDPFMVLQPYKRYDRAEVYLNEPFVGWQTYSTYKDSLGYNSFIMGNSCTMGLRTEDWEQYLDAGRAFRFFDNLEGLGGIADKLEILDADGATINNLFILIDPSSLQHYLPEKTFMHILPPGASQISSAQFHLKMLQGYLNPDVMIPYLYYKYTAEVTPYMERKCLVTKHILREPYTNNGFHPMSSTIDQIGDDYWQTINWRRDEQAPQNITHEGPYIFQQQIKCLETIKRIVDKHHAQIKVVMNPHYGVYVKTHPHDIAKMKEILGDNVVFDLTAEESFVSDVYDYFEPDHFRPVLGRRILQYVYSAETDSSALLSVDQSKVQN